jgi:transposase
MKNKKVAFANENGKIRLKAIEMYQKGSTKRDVSIQFCVHETTIAEWITMYEEGDVERLNTYMKPRPIYELNAKSIRKDIKKASGKESEVLQSLLDLANGMSLNDAAEKNGISPQGLAKRRRMYLKNL